MSNKFSKHKWWIVTALLTLPLIAIAAVPNTFMPNTTISSAAVNANFAALDARIAALEAATAKTSATTMSGAINPITTATGPRNVMFTASGSNPWLVIVSASAFWGVTTTGGPLDLAIALDGVKIGDLQGFTNEAGSHKAIPTRTFTVPTPSAGTHTIGISYGNANTTTDQNDYFNVTVVEMH